MFANGAGKAITNDRESVAAQAANSVNGKTTRKLGNFYSSERMFLLVILFSQGKVFLVIASFFFFKEKNSLLLLS